MRFTRNLIDRGHIYLVFVVRYIGLSTYKFKDSLMTVFEILHADELVDMTIDRCFNCVVCTVNIECQFAYDRCLVTACVSFANLELGSSALVEGEIEESEEKSRNN